MNLLPYLMINLQYVPLIHLIHHLITTKTLLLITIKEHSISTNKNIIGKELSENSRERIRGELFDLGVNVVHLIEYNPFDISDHIGSSVQIVPENLSGHDDATGLWIHANITCDYTD